MNKSVKKQAAAKKLLKVGVEGKVKATKSERTVSSVARELIVAGKTNAEVWEVISKEFKLDDGKKGYPAWYRSEVKRKGQPAKPPEERRVGDRRKSERRAETK